MMVRAGIAGLCMALIFLLTGCRTTEVAPPEPTAVPRQATSTQTQAPTSTPTRPAPTPTFTPNPPSATFTPVTPSPTSTITPTPSITPTPTLIDGTAPPLPHIGVEFILNGDREKPLVALTFDVGQTPQIPAGFDWDIFNILVEYQAPATFFLGGDWMRTHPAETRALDQVPFFELGNHSWSHPDMRTLAEPDMSAEVLKTQDILYQLTGHQTRLFRLPSGLYNELVLSVVAWHGLYTIQWDVVTGDPDPNITAEDMLEKAVKPRTQNGSIIIMHANGRGWHTAEALPDMIEYLRGEGYTLVTISELLGVE